MYSNNFSRFSCINSCLCDYAIAQDIRLADGSGPYEGRVEVRTLPDGVWNTVCDDLWDRNDGKVACRQLGYSTDGLISYSGPSSPYGPGTGRIRLDNLRCIGSENSLFECPRSDGKEVYNVSGMHLFSFS